jgi:hypothetical protein
MLFAGLGWILLGQPGRVRAFSLGARTRLHSWPTSVRGKFSLCGIVVSRPTWHGQYFAAG